MTSFGLLFRTKDTVAVGTEACSATSRMVERFIEPNAKRAGRLFGGLLASTSYCVRGRLSAAEAHQSGRRWAQAHVISETWPQNDGKPRQLSSVQSSEAPIFP